MASNYKIEINSLNGANEDSWNELVTRSKEGSVFAQSAYLEALSVKPELISIKSNLEIVAGILLPKNAIGLRTNPILAKNLGLIYSPELSDKQRRSVAEIVAKECRVFSSFDYNFSVGFDDWLAFHWQGFRQTTRYTYRIAPTRQDDWRMNLAGNTKNDTSHAERSGVFIHDVDNSSNLIDLVTGTFARQGAKSPLRKSKLSAFIDSLLRLKIATIKEAVDPHGNCMAALCLARDEKAEFLILSGFREGAIRGTTSLLIAAAVDQCLDAGRIFDFEGSMIKPIEKFYRGFGGALTPYHRIYNGSFINSAKELTVPIAKRLLRYNR